MPVEVTLVDDVPTFWVDSQRPTLAASLVFRTGLVDESLPTSGWTHLLEHQALHDREGGTLEVNGSVSLLHCRFDFHGEADRVAEALTDVAGWLSSPTFSRLDREKSVLAAESAWRGGSQAAEALAWRYGARGPGLAAYGELGRTHATPEALTELARRAFTSGNAALVLDGPPPAGLRLPLSGGELRPAPTAVPCGGLAPSAYAMATRGVVVSGVVEHGAAGHVLAEAVAQLFTEQFRHRQGMAYAPWGSNEPVDDGHAVVLAGSDASDELLPSIADRALVQLQRLARGDVKPDFVDAITLRMAQGISDPYRSAGLALRAAVDYLRGAEMGDLDEALAELEDVDVDALSRVASGFMDTLLIGVPPVAQLTGNLAFAQMPTSSEAIPGATHRSQNRPVDRELLRVGPAGLQVGEPRALRTILSDDVEGMVVHPDGGRRVIARDGWAIEVEPTMWARGGDAVRALDRVVPAERRLPGEPRDVRRLPRPEPRARLLWRRFAGSVDVLLTVLAVLAVVFLFVSWLRTGSLFSYRNIFLATVAVVWGYRKLSG